MPSRSGFALANWHATFAAPIGLETGLNAHLIDAPGHVGAETPAECFFEVLPPVVFRPAYRVSLTVDPQSSEEPDFVDVQMSPAHGQEPWTCLPAVSKPSASTHAPNVLVCPA